MAFARAEVGKHPYDLGDKSVQDDAALDCSGFVRWVFLTVLGLDVGSGGGTWWQAEWCKAHGDPVGRPWQDGDLVFFYDDKASPTVPTHVGIATSVGTVIEETGSWAGNVYESQVAGRWDADYVKAWRPRF